MIDTEQAERDLIATVLTTKNEVEKVMAIDSVSLKMINGKTNNSIWGAIKSLSDGGHIVDLQGVFGRIPSDDIAYLAEITQSSMKMDSLLKGYVTRVKQGAYLYEAHKRATEALNVINELTDLTAIEAVPEAIEKVFEGLALDAMNNKPVHFKEVAQDYVQRINDKVNGKEDDHIVKSGITELDKHTGGFNVTDLITLAGMSGSGKTEFAVKLMTSIAKSGGSSLIFSLEMSNAQVAERAISQEAQLPPSALRNPEQLEENNGWQRMSTATGNLINNQMYLYDQTGLTVRNIISMARAHKARHPDLNFIVVDHVGLMELEGGSGGLHHLQVGDISKKLKQLAKDIEVPVLLLSQVVGKVIIQRPVKDRIPTAQDVKDSSRIEEDSDLILFTHRQKTHDDKAPQIAEVVFGKARHAIMGTRVYFNFTNGHFNPTDQAHAYNIMDSYYNATPDKKGSANF